MGRLAHLLEHPGDFASHAAHMMVPRRKSSISGVVVLALFVAGLAWMWPEIQRYIKMKRM